MGLNKAVGLLSIILGLIFIIFPMFSAELVSVIVGASLLFFGILTVYIGFTMRHDTDVLAIATMIIGLLAIVFGILFMFYIDAMSFLIGLQFYIVGFIMILFGIVGLISGITRISLFTSILVLIMGIVTIALAIFAVDQPIYVATIIGIVLIIEGVADLLV